MKLETSETKLPKRNQVLADIRRPRTTVQFLAGAESDWSRARITSDRRLPFRINESSKNR